MENIEKILAENNYLQRELARAKLEIEKLRVEAATLKLLLDDFKKRPDVQAERLADRISALEKRQSAYEVKAGHEINEREISREHPSPATPLPSTDLLSFFHPQRARLEQDLAALQAKPSRRGKNSCD